MTSPETATAPMGPLALLFGGVACVACLNALAFAMTAAFGVSVIPAALFEGVWGYALSGLFLIAFGAVAVRGHKHAQAAVAAGETPNPYWMFHPRRALTALAIGLVGVSVLALLVQVAVDAFTGFTYTILWGRTVPFIAIAVAWMVNGELNRRALNP
jgi:hypothetical protein